MNPTIRFLPPPADLSDRVGGYIIEGLTSISDLIMEDLRQKQRAIGQEVIGKFMEEDERFSASPLSHFGFAQRDVLALMRWFAALSVDIVLYTAHEAKGEEADSRIPIRGPALAGTAATDRVPREVGDCIHFEGYTEEVESLDPATNTKVKRMHNRVRAFFMPHPDPRIPGVLYKCKPRVPAETIPELLNKWPGGFFEPTIHSGLDDFLRFEDELLARSSDRERKWKEEIDAKIRACKAQ
jgi:hypothetical protein